ncbi:MAG: hypothetical protein KJ645_09335 [Planctomycetes bacterium]|nr:hypothetical protein [Planctomycetota bacterium]
MKTARITTFLLILGCFLCINGKTCVPCLINLFLHQLHTMDREAVQCGFSCHTCPCEEMVEGEIHDHQHFSSDPRAHSFHLLIAQDVANNQANKSFKSALMAYSLEIPFFRKTHAILPSDRSRGFSIWESFPDTPLFLQYAKLLI